MTSQDMHGRELLGRMIGGLVPAEPALAAIIRAQRKQTGDNVIAAADLSPSEFWCLFESDYEDGLYFVPHAMNALQQMQPGYGVICEQLVAFLWVHSEKLSRDGIYRLCIQELHALCTTWSLHFDPFTRVKRRADGELQCCCDELEPGPFDLLLNALTEWDLQCDDVSVRHAVLDKWARRVTTPAKSGCVLDFALRTKCCPNDMRVYRDPFVLDAMFDGQLLYRHWEHCGELLQRKCSPEFCQLVEDRLM